MSFYKKTIRDVDLNNKRVLVRVDYNVPIKNGQILADYRIKESLPTINYLLEQNAKIILCSHMGRPEGRIGILDLPKIIRSQSELSRAKTVLSEGEVAIATSKEEKRFTADRIRSGDGGVLGKSSEEYSLKPCAQRLSKLLDRPVQFIDDCVGEAVEQKVVGLESGQIIMLENLRFHLEEEACDTEFAKKLASYGDVFVQDAFGVVHHPAVSVTELPKYMSSVAGLLVEKEVDTITNAIENPNRPVMAILGGAKISDKIDILNRFIDIADFVAVGGAMANTFLLAEGIAVGKSLVEPEAVKLAKQIIKKARTKSSEQRFTFYVPQDGVVAKSLDKTAKTRLVDWDAHVIASIENYPKQAPRQTEHVREDELILDIGPFSGAFIAGAMQSMSTVIWNGTMGVTETPAISGPVGPFSHGTEIIVDAMLGEYGNRPFTLVGGGDTVGYIQERKLTDMFNHVSTGGGASMELMSGKPLPGVEALQDK